jgi:hypothetical protein
MLWSSFKETSPLGFDALHMAEGDEVVPLGRYKSGATTRREPPAAYGGLKRRSGLGNRLVPVLDNF